MGKRYRQKIEDFLEKWLKQTLQLSLHPQFREERGRQHHKLGDESVGSIPDETC